MLSSTIRNTYDLLHQPKRLNCPRNLWKKILLELRERGGGRRESGGFLLGYVDRGRRYVRDFVAYDVIDPNALQGIIVFDASNIDAVWRLCERTGMEVIADVHTHPGGYGQSRTDQAHPMIPRKGHLAMIIPNYADRLYRPGEVGLYEFRGHDGWLDHSALGPAFLRLEWISCPTQ
jgi:proteasome lid subunit RPN8/RPN11